MTTTTRLLAPPVVAARRAVSRRSLDPWVIRQVASSRTSTDRDDVCTSPHTSVTSKSSRMARTASDAAADTATSNSAPSAYAATSSSSRTVAWLRRVSTYCRTRRVSAFADERQWTCRRSSPGTYSRRAWNARSLVAGWSLGTPSRSLISPGSRARSSVSRGRTSSSSRRGPAGPPPQQAERVGADVHDRPHDVHAARQRRDLDRLGALGPGRDERQPQRAGLPRDVEPHRGADQRHPPGPDRDLGRGRLTRGHPVGVDPEPAERRLRQQDQDERRDQQERADGRDHPELEPAQPAVHGPRQQRSAARPTGRPW